MSNEEAQEALNISRGRVFVRWKEHRDVLTASIDALIRYDGSVRR